MTTANPFLNVKYFGQWRGPASAPERIELVRSFTRAQCRAALKLRGLQGTVVKAVERRLRQLDAERRSR